MKMRWLVILVKHSDHNAEKPTQLRHVLILALAPGRAHPA
jgi:hypothetical protein